MRHLFGARSASHYAQSDTIPVYVLDSIFIWASYFTFVVLGNNCVLPTCFLQSLSGEDGKVIVDISDGANSGNTIQARGDPGVQSDSGALSRSSRPYFPVTVLRPQ